MFSRLGDGQFAVAFRVNKEKCLDPSFKGVTLTDEAINAINNNQVYESDNLIAAKPIKGPHPEHSEFRLMQCLQKILGKGDDCVVYFTVNSPCLKTCLDSGPYSIIASLQQLEKYNGIKAFAFKDIWRFDKRNKVIAKLKEIALGLPYYECKRNSAECIRL